jgi:hypothetical protein
VKSTIPRGFHQSVKENAGIGPRLYHGEGSSNHSVQGTTEAYAEDNEEYHENPHSGVIHTEILT